MDAMAMLDVDAHESGDECDPEFEVAVNLLIISGSDNNTLSDCPES